MEHGLCTFLNSLVHGFPLHRASNESENGGNQTPEHEGTDANDFVQEHLVADGRVVGVSEVESSRCRNCFIYGGVNNPGSGAEGH